MNIILVNIETNKPLAIGDEVRGFRGEKGILNDARPDEGKNGKVYVKFEDSKFSRSFYPSVINCEFRDETNWKQSLGKSN